LIERVSPIAQEHGDAVHLAPFHSLESFESGAQRQRRIYREQGNWKAVTDDMKGRFEAEVNGAQG
jgi:gamma-glutamyl:cysteine ligase YbdK (ATP-grasp superfamily)